MVGIVLVTHNGLGDSLMDCLRHILGQIPTHIRSLSVLASHNPVEKEAELRELVKQLDQGDGVLLLIDVYGATPSNIAKRVCRPNRVEGVAGVNLPMLLRVGCCTGKTLAEMVLRAQLGGKECIVPLNSEMESYDVGTRCTDHQ
jgi:PTS system ascorbate-specific IIA component